ncbi:MAG: protease Do [Candidatus Dactylopiibacterium carminicum]|uniref:Probable periplasmic serine endoprotease DegP-like n=1 Tax=Candidatus Dactylopiibacterium carminicum TaxID=857335 RepID=A0A272ESP9_9RHOO|nr:Do family serine endopeptidase [Candidatus Dactylopiibacterium carminicum]KAF7599088.1 protease Do [Candidatus Dactylopiibacterium carminicum]PAS93151.1 MAG: protease Do [Candidatus Dactylopiibacterium carminicum]PAS99102.1 MAG: protease Do [Candidatus Dactylopiibacterium carminicum]
MLRVLLLCCCLLGGTMSASARNLPEFATLAAAQAGVVVNISAVRAPAQTSAPFLQPEAKPDLPSWLRKLLPSRPDTDDGEGVEDDGRSVGSGFVIAPDGYILTNAHVVEDATEILVRLADKREYLARLVGADTRSDVALLKVDAERLPVARLGDPARLRVGDWVLAIGSPFGFESSVTAGIVSAKGRALPDESLVPFIQTDVAINPGNSGGPLFNLAGEVVGINSQIYSRTGGFMGMSFSIPIDVAMDVQAQLRESGKVNRGRIGVLIQEVTQDLAESFALPAARGALVSEVEAGGPAARAGILVGDVLLAFNGRRIESSVELPRVVSATRPGTRSHLEYWRDGRMQSAVLEVTSFPDEQKAVVQRSDKLPPGANRLGLLLAEPTREQRQTLELPAGGVVITRVAGAAARAELKAGDAVVDLVIRGRSHAVVSPRQFDQLLADVPKGGALGLRVRRGPSQSFVALRLPAH